MAFNYGQSPPNYENTGYAAYPYGNDSYQNQFQNQEQYGDSDYYQNAAPPYPPVTPPSLSGPQRLAPPAPRSGGNKITAVIAPPPAMKPLSTSAGLPERKVTSPGSPASSPDSARIPLKNGSSPTSLSRNRYATPLSNSAVSRNDLSTTFPKQLPISMSAPNISGSYSYNPSPSFQESGNSKSKPLRSSNTDSDSVSGRMASSKSQGSIPSAIPPQFRQLPSAPAITNRSTSPSRNNFGIDPIPEDLDSVPPPFEPVLPPSLPPTPIKLPSGSPIKSGGRPPLTQGHSPRKILPLQNKEFTESLDATANSHSDLSALALSPRNDDGVGGSKGFGYFPPNPVAAVRKLPSTSNDRDQFTPPKSNMNSNGPITTPNKPKVYKFMHNRDGDYARSEGDIPPPQSAPLPVLSHSLPSKRGPNQLNISVSPTGPRRDFEPRGNISDSHFLPNSGPRIGPFPNDTDPNYSPSKQRPNFAISNSVPLQPPQRQPPKPQFQPNIAPPTTWGSPPTPSPASPPPAPHALFKRSVTLPNSPAPSSPPPIPPPFNPSNNSPSVSAYDTSYSPQASTPTFSPQFVPASPPSYSINPGNLPPPARMPPIKPQSEPPRLRRSRSVGQIQVAKAKSEYSEKDNEKDKALTSLERSKRLFDGDERKRGSIMSTATMMKVEACQIQSKRKKVIYMVTCRMGGVSWTIYRTFGRFQKFSQIVLNSSSLKALCSNLYFTPLFKHNEAFFPLESKAMKNKADKLEKAFVEARHHELQRWLSNVIVYKRHVFGNDDLANEFAHVFGPTQIGDKKGDDFVFPFKVFHI